MLSYLRRFYVLSLIHFFVFLGMIAVWILPVWGGEPLPFPPRRSIVGNSRTVNVVPDVSHVPEPGHYRLWRRTIQIDQAGFVKPHFVNVHLSPGDVLTVRSASGEIIEEITGRGPKQAGTFWGLSVFGDTLRLELSYSHSYTEPPFRIDQILLGDTSLMEGALPGAQESICGTQGDFEDVACYQTNSRKWANVLASVGVLSVGGDPSSPDPNVGLYCSGVNISPDNMILTNQHCVRDQAECNHTEFIFQYRRQGCNNGTATTAWKSYRCDEVIMASRFARCEVDANTLDFSLQTVIGNPSATFGFATPDANPVTSGENVYMIQHSDGRPQEINHGGGADFVVDEQGLRYFGTLDTEGGSSGAPIFREADGKLVGLHHCGGCETRGIGNRGVRMADIYPLVAPFLCTTAPTLAGVEGEDIQEVHGNGDAIIDPGEIWQFTPRIRNTSCSMAASGVFAFVGVNAASQQSIVVLDTRVDFGTVPPGQTVSALTPVRFQLAATASCSGQILLDLIDIGMTGGGPFPDTPRILSAVIGFRKTATLLFEDFAAGMPARWSIQHRGSGSGAAATWTTANPGRRTLGLTAPFAIVDSDALGPGQTMNERLLSPLVDASGFARVTLQFSHVFNWYNLSQNEQAIVEVRSHATNGAWSEVARFGPGDASGRVLIDLTAQAAGQSHVRVRFRYIKAVFERWWAIDDILLLGEHEATCRNFARPVPIFADSFESATTSAWSQDIAESGAAIVSPQAALLGTSLGLQLNIHNTRPLYVQDDTPDGEIHYRVYFAFDPHSITMLERSQHNILTLFDDDHVSPGVALVRLLFRDGQHWLSALARLDDGSWAKTPFVPLAPGPHTVVLDWQKASRPAAHDGRLFFWVDKKMKGALENLDNDERVVDFIRWGAAGGVDDGTYGTMYFDHFSSWR